MTASSLSTLAAAPAARPEPSSRREAWLNQLRVAIRRAARNPSTLAGSIIVLLLVLAAATAPLLATHDPNAQALHDCGAAEMILDRFSDVFFNSVQQ